jgi:hypothetical protein
MTAPTATTGVEAAQKIRREYRGKDGNDDGGAETAPRAVVAPTQTQTATPNAWTRKRPHRLTSNNAATAAATTTAQTDQQQRGDADDAETDQHQARRHGDAATLRLTINRPDDAATLRQQARRHGGPDDAATRRR